MKRVQSGRGTLKDPGGKKGKGKSDRNYWQLRLYVAGTTSRSQAAVANLRDICERNIAGHYSIEVIDLLENPGMARGDEIVAIPTLVRRLPPPVKKIIGDLSKEERVIVGLDLKSLGDK